MSGFDGMFKSQVFAADQRMRGVAAMGDAITGGAESLARGVVEGRQLAMKEAESQANVRMIETQRALTQQKLRELQEIDMTEQGRLAVEGQREAVLGARLQREAAEHQFNRQKERDARSGAGDEVLGETLKRWSDFVKNPEAVLASGLVMKDGKIRPGTPAEVEEYRKEVEADAGRQRRALNPYLERDRLGRELARVQKQYDEGGAKTKADLLPILEKLRADYAAEFGPPPAAGGDGTPPPQATPGAPPPTAAAAKKEPAGVSPPPLIISNVFNDPAWKDSPALSLFNVDAETRYGMSRGLAAVAEQLLQLRRSQGRDYDPAQIHKLALEAAQKSPAVFGFAMKAGGFGDEEIRRRLRATFPAMEDKKALDQIMRYVNDGGQ